MRAIILMIGLLAGLTFTAFADDDIAAAQAIIGSQTEAFSRDDDAAAFAFAAPALQEMFQEPAIFMAMVRNRYAAVYRHKSFEFGDARVVDGKIAQNVHIQGCRRRTMGGSLHTGAPAGRQPEDYRLHAAENDRRLVRCRHFTASDSCT